MTDLISLVTSIAACMSAVAAFMAVRQNYKQRMASYRPDLVLVRTPIQAKIFETPGGIPHWTNDGNNDETNDVAIKLFSIPLVNVGLGAAREIRVVWNFPIHEFVSSVNRLAQVSLTPAYFEYRNNLLSFKTSDNQWVVKWQGESHIDFVLPASTNQTRTGLIVPLVYISLVSYFYQLAISGNDDEHRKTGEPRTFDIPDIPPLKCRIEYRDIGQVKYSVDWLVYTEAGVIRDGSFKGELYGSRRGT
ncbi:MAG: hypothetical protein F4X63_03160 [Nitrospira sp. SB0662_bin_26]|nr:hypothetical protein [Nitrospira sp. SB0662_bin_26]